jgi:choline dehydrogenase-like flavoprotein
VHRGRGSLIQIKSSGGGPGTARRNGAGHEGRLTTEKLRLEAEPGAIFPWETWCCEGGSNPRPLPYQARELRFAPVRGGLTRSPNSFTRNASAAETPLDVLDSRNLASMDHDWGFTAVPVPGRTIPYRRGKLVGGCSAMNSCAVLWGRREDFDEWVALGNPEWTWDQVEPYFRDLETDQDYPDPPHGISGPLPITRFKEEELIPIQRAFRDGCRVVGLADLADFNNSDEGGVGPWPMNRIETTRISAATAFLAEARSRPNLTVRQNTLVSRVVLDGKRAVAVELSDGELLEAERIVLSAGAFGSTAILLRSGVGPAREVAALGITSRIDLPGVGARLWDHASVPIRLVPKPGQCVPGRDPRFQMAARFTLPKSNVFNDAMLVLVTHMDLRPFPALMDEIGRARGRAPQCRDNAASWPWPSFPSKLRSKRPTQHRPRVHLRS